MNKGSFLYRLAVVLIGSLMGPISLQAQDADPFPDVNPHDYYGSMTLSVCVVDEGQTLTHDVVVAAYSGDQLRGKGAPQDAKRPGVVYLTAWGDATGEELYFRVYAQGRVVEVRPAGFAYQHNGIVGSPKHPYLLDLADACATDISLYDRSDNSLTLMDYHAYWANVTLSGRTLYKDGAWNTLSLPFDVGAEQMALPDHPLHEAIIWQMDTENLYDGGRQTGYDAGTGRLCLYFRPVGSIRAGVPCLVRWDKAEGYDQTASEERDVKNPVFDHVTIDYGQDAQARMAVCSHDGAVSFDGNYSPTEVAAGDPTVLFLDTDNTLRTQNPDHSGTLRSFRASFRLHGIDFAQIRSVALGLGDETTAIPSMTLQPDADRAEWHTLNGQRLGEKPARPGIYLCGQRKVLVK